MYGMMIPIRLLVNLISKRGVVIFIFENITNRGMSTQCTGTIIPIMKYVSVAPESLNLILAIPNAAIAPRRRLTASVNTHTNTEFQSAIPSLPLVQAKM